MAILTILGSPENDKRMISWLSKLDKEPNLEELLTIAEAIRKY